MGCVGCVFFGFWRNYIRNFAFVRKVINWHLIWICKSKCIYNNYFMVENTHHKCKTPNQNFISYFTPKWRKIYHILPSAESKTSNRFYDPKRTFFGHVLNPRSKVSSLHPFPYISSEHYVDSVKVDSDSLHNFAINFLILYLVINLINH
jgi:hypothetical protein